MTGGASALYAGPVAHLRVRPRRHALRYRIFQTLLDLDELPGLDRRLRLFSHNRFNLISFHDRDHGDGSGNLRAYVKGVLRDAGMDGAGDGPIRLMAMPRVLGYVFNPISLYFCHDGEGRLRAVLYEVNNTFGQRHSYLFPTDGDAAAERHACAKAFYVSPFMEMDMTYAFEVTPPSDRFALTIHGGDADGLLITAAFSGDRAPLNDRTLLHAFLTHPLLTLKVVAGIHWEAVKILSKGVRMTRKPPKPETAVTIG